MKFDRRAGSFSKGGRGMGTRLFHPRLGPRNNRVHTGRGYTYKLSCLPVTTGVPGFISWKYARRGICPGVESVVDVHVIYRRCNQAFPFFFLFQMWTVARSIIDSHYVWSNWKSQWARWAIISTSLKCTFFYFKPLHFTFANESNFDFCDSRLEKNSSDFFNEI